MGIRSILVIILMAYVIVSCKEVLEVYKPTVASVKDSSFIATDIETAQLKNVLIEDFTGVKCQNCPSGHKQIETIKAAHPERVISIGLHSSLQSSPFQYSPYDFYSDEAEALHQKYQIPSKPSALVDRTLYNGVLQLSRTNWTAAADARLTKTSPVNIHIENAYSADSSKLETKMKLHFTADVTEKLNYIIYLEESNIICPQLLPSSDVDTFYNHQDVFRKVIGGSTDGNSITESTVKGRTIIKYFYTYLKPEYKAANMKTIVSVFKSGADNEVIHCEEAKLIK